MTSELSHLMFPHSNVALSSRMAIIVDTMREMSEHTDPQAMVHAYQQRMGRIFPADRRISLSRRGLDAPHYRVTRSTVWPQKVNPWEQPNALPLHSGGVLSDLLYADEPSIIEDLQLATDDPAHEHLTGQRSLMAIPLYEQGVATNMVVLTREHAGAFDATVFPELVWMSNLFGRATHSLVLAERARKAYDALDRELKAVADIQRFLLPAEIPQIPTLQIARHYQTSQRAGGDYYDFFPQPDGRWGILIADVSGHGTPAAVFMAITHAIAHTNPHPIECPGNFLGFINDQLTRRYSLKGIFVTAFYGVYDPQKRTLHYASAGHNPPRVKHCAAGHISALDGAQALPLGINRNVEYPVCHVDMQPGDQIIMYTDGITETRNRADDEYGLKRLDALLEDCCQDADGLIAAVLADVERFSEGLPAEDDRTLLIGKVS
jgi:sigma-B regulation protein RsbU (phosphoserine phosphatase)